MSGRLRPPKPISKEEAMPQVDKILSDYALCSPDITYQHFNPSDDHPRGALKVKTADSEMTYPIGIQDGGVMIDTTLVPYLEGMPTLVATIDDIRKKFEK